MRPSAKHEQSSDPISIAPRSILPSLAPAFLATRRWIPLRPLHLGEQYIRVDSKEAWRAPRVAWTTIIQRRSSKCVNVTQRVAATAISRLWSTCNARYAIYGLITLRCGILEPRFAPARLFVFLVVTPSIPISSALIVIVTVHLHIVILSTESTMSSNHCGGTIASPILPNNTGTRVCGMPATNQTVMHNCCTGTGSISTYECWNYCPFTGTLQEWVQCASGGSHNGGSNNTVSPVGLFCEAGSDGNVTQSLAVPTSAGLLRASAPKFSVLLALMLLASFFVARTTAYIVPSEDASLTKRQSASNGSCTFKQASNYTRTGSTQIVSAGMRCLSPSFCPYVQSVQTSLTTNNRTINGSSAAAAEYDAFFSLLGNATGRIFPALSALNITYEFGVSGSTSFELGWTPYAVSGLVSILCKPSAIASLTG